MKTEFNLVCKNGEVPEFIRTLGKHYRIHDLITLQGIVRESKLLMNEFWAFRASHFDKVARNISSALRHLNKPAWGTKKLPTHGYPDATQGDLLSAALSTSFDVDCVEILKDIRTAAEELDQEIRDEKIMGSPGKPHVEAAVSHLVLYWRDTLRRAAVAVRWRRKQRGGVPILEGLDEESRVVDFVSDVMINIASINGVGHAIDAIFQKK